MVSRKLQAARQFCRPIQRQLRTRTRCDFRGKVEVAIRGYESLRTAIQSRVSIEQAQQWSRRFLASEPLKGEGSKLVVTDVSNKQ